MNEIPDFEDAVASFRQFLVQTGHPSNILWVFREDIWKRSPSDVVLRFPSQIKNLALAKKVFGDGRKKGLIDVHAIATVDDRVAATVWFPKFTDEEIQGWNRGMKLSIADPLPSAKSVGALRWLSFRLHPRFRHYQRCELRIGTKAWAAAQAPNFERMSMKTISLSLILLLVTLGSHFAHAQKVQRANSPDGVVRELYRVHNDGRGGVFEATGKKYIYKFFDQKLADLIWKNISETPEGEVGNLDFDPLYNAQDTKITNFQISRTVAVGDESTVIVNFRNFGQRTRVKFKLHRGREGWRIKNVIYGDESDLFKILSPSP